MKCCLNRESRLAPNSLWNKQCNYFAYKQCWYCYAEARFDYFLSNSFILMIETFDAIHTRIVQTNISYNTIAIIRALGSLVIMPA